MTAATDPQRVVAWQWHTEGPQFCASEERSNRLAAGDGFAKGYTIPLVRESLLAEAESRIDALQAQVDAVRTLAEWWLSDPQDNPDANELHARQVRAALGEAK
jgi:hypothetical protein